MMRTRIIRGEERGTSAEKCWKDKLARQNGPGQYVIMHANGRAVCERASDAASAREPAPQSGAPVRASRPVSCRLLPGYRIAHRLAHSEAAGCALPAAADCSGFQ